MHISAGFDNPRGLVQITLGYLVFVLCERNAGQPDARATGAVPLDRLRVALWVVVILFCAAMVRRPLLFFVTSPTDFAIMRGLVGVAALLAALGLCLNLGSEHARSRLLCWAIAVCLVLARVYVLRSSPDPPVDVYTILTEGYQYLANGQDPYSQPYTDIYGGRFGYRPQFAYWPGVIVPHMLAWLPSGDIRVATIACDLVTFVGVSRLVRRLVGPTALSWLVALVWLGFPASLLMLEQAWIDGLLVASSVLFLLLVLERRWSWAGVALGYLISVKQYAVLLGGITLVLLTFHPRSRASSARTVGWATVAFSCVLLPFVLWDWRGLYRSTLQNLVDIPMRTDALTWVAALHNSVGLTIPGWVTAATSLMAFGLAVARLARAGLKSRRSGREVDLTAWTYALILVYGAVFLLGKQAFCNYYYLLAFFVLLHGCLKLRPGGLGSRMETALASRSVGP